MSIDAIGSVVAGVSALAASRTELAAGNGSANTGQSSAADQAASDQADATVVAISQEALAQQQAAEDQAAQDAASAAASTSATASGVTGAVSSDWASGAPTVDNAVVQEALDALDEASRENNIQLQQDAIQAQQDQTTLEQKTVQGAATASAQREDDIVLAAINAGIRVAFGALSTPITGDPALREPGKIDIVA